MPHIFQISFPGNHYNIESSNFNDFQNMLIHIQQDINEDILYDEFCSSKDVMCSISNYGNNVEKWVSMMTEAKAKGRFIKA